MRASLGGLPVVGASERPWHASEAGILVSALVGQSTARQAHWV